MNKPKISIICPVYNAESSLIRCLESITAQTFSDWELIVVDDGSVDKSLSICEDFSKKDERIKVIHKINEGVSAARQLGLETSVGEFVIHVDADDWIESQMLSDLYQKAQEEKADFVICDYYCDINEKSIYMVQKPSELRPSIVLKEIFGKLHGSCWNKLVRRSACIDYRAHFPNGINYAEDVCFNVQLLIHDVKIAYLPHAYYHYVQISSSLTNNYTRVTLKNCMSYVDFIGNLLPPNSDEIIQAKEMVKTNAFKAGILSDRELKTLYPEVKRSGSNKKYERLGYYIAFNVGQRYARILFDLIKSLVWLRQKIFFSCRNKFI